MATPRSLATSESLAVLSDAVNQTLIDTGRFFKSSGSLQCRAQLRASIPTSYQRFQVALDMLSEQIFIAKAFLEKDYENITAQKLAPKLEPQPEPAPIVAPAAPAPAPTPAPAPAPPAPLPDPAPTVAVGTATTAPSHPPPEDISMPEAPDSTVDEHIKESTGKAETLEQPIKTEPGHLGEFEQTGTENVSVTTTEPVGASKADENQDKTSHSLPTSMGDEMNFDSMLATTGEASNEFDLNFNFTNDEIGDQNFLAGADFGNSSSTMAGETLNDNGAGSISSLLPGLESYATDNNAGDNFSFDLPKLDDQSMGGQGSSGQDDLMGPGESSFDDLFLEKDNLEGDDSLLGGGDLMDLGELDDSWLN